MKRSLSSPLISFVRRLGRSLPKFAIRFSEVFFRFSESFQISESFRFSSENQLFPPHIRISTRFRFSESFQIIYSYQIFYSFQIFSSFQIFYSFQNIHLFLSLLHFYSDSSLRATTASLAWDQCGKWIHIEGDLASPSGIWSLCFRLECLSPRWNYFMSTSYLVFLVRFVGGWQLNRITSTD